MAVRIRLARGGTKKRPFYQIVIADARAPRDGRFIEKVGFFNPLLPKDHVDSVRLNKEAIETWLKKGAEPTERVAKILSNFGLVEKPAIPTQTKKNQPKAKAQERLKAAEEKAAAAKAAAEEAAEAAKQAEAQAQEQPQEQPQEAPAENAAEPAAEQENA